MLLFSGMDLSTEDILSPQIESFLNSHVPSFKYVLPFCLLRALYCTSQSSALREEQFNRSADGGHTRERVTQSPVALGLIKKILDVRSCVCHFSDGRSSRRQFSSTLKEGTEEA